MHEHQCPGPFRASHPLVLASGSPRRRDLLASLGLNFEVRPSAAAESLPRDHEAPSDYAMRLARTKAMDDAASQKDAVVLAADTIVVLGSEILGKPVDAEDAVRMLNTLSGREHQIITACCLVISEPFMIEEFTALTRVWLAPQNPGTLSA